MKSLGCFAISFLLCFIVFAKLSFCKTYFDESSQNQVSNNKNQANQNYTTQANKDAAIKFMLEKNYKECVKYSEQYNISLGKPQDGYFQDPLFFNDVYECYTETANENLHIVFASIVNGYKNAKIQKFNEKPKDFYEFFLTNIMFFAKTRNAQAINYVSSYIPYIDTILYYTASAYIEIYDYSQGSYFLKSCININSLNSLCLFNLAILMDKSGDYKNATINYSKFLQSCKNSSAQSRLDYSICKTSNNTFKQAYQRLEYLNNKYFFNY
jgi:hypothetical protein